MPVFQVIDSGGSLSDELVPITDLHFGGNLLINYIDFTNPISDFSESVAELGLTTIRYPGGAVTEQFFDVTNPNASSVEYQGAVVDLVPFSDFIGYAAANDVSVTIVIPTRDGFTTTAEEALLDGTYGNRNIDATFVENAASFAVDAIQSAIASGVVVDSFEIGNEFWGSGKMTAAEYGQLAAEMSIAIETQLIAVGIPANEQPDIIVQGIVSAGKYSPTPWSTGGLFIYEMEDGSLWSSPIEYTAGQTPPDYENVAVSLVLGEYDVPNQGIINFQNHQIIEALIAAGAIDALDGIVLHYYGDVDISDIDVLDQRVFEVLELYSLLDELRSPHLPPLTQFITEWNIRGGETHPRNGNGGLLQAQYLIEMFYEMVTNGIDAAHVWPIRNAGTQLSSLIDVDGEGLSIAGEVFSVMSELLIGLTPSLDYEFSHINGTGSIDIHGFEDNTREVFFVSERSGIDDIFTLDLTDVLDGGHFFFSVMILGAHGNPTNPNAEPIWAQNGISVINGIPVIDLLLSPYSIAVVEVTYITNSSDTINGSLANDRIDGLGGDDELFGHEGEDTLYGGYGSDDLNGGSGDDVLYGDAGNDTLTGGEGSDALLGRAGDDLLVIDQDDLYADGGTGEDTLSLADLDSGASIWTLDKIIELDNWVVSFDNIECIEGSSFGDGFSVSTSNIDIFGMSGNDWFEIFASGNFLVSGGDGDDVFNIFCEAHGRYFGDGGNDTFNIFSGSGTYRGGSGDDTFNSFNSNSDTFVFSVDQGDDTISGFNVEIDRIALELNAGDTYQVLELSSGTMIDFDQGGSVFLAGAFGEIDIYFLF